MFNNTFSDFDTQIIQNHLMKSYFENSSSFSFLSDEENNDEFEREQYPFIVLNGIKTRIVWVTNYINNEDFPIHVLADDPLLHIDNISSSTIEQESLLSNEKDDNSLFKKIHTLDLSKLNLDDLLLLLYRLQQKTTKNAVTTSTSTISSSSSSSSSSGFIERKPSYQTLTLHSLSPTLSHAVQSSLSMLNEIPSYSHSLHRQQSSFTLSNIADVPKQLTTTLTKPISSCHFQNSKPFPSPNDVVDKLLQSYNLSNNQKINKPKFQQYSPSYTYQESQQHKAKLISNLLSKKKEKKSNKSIFKSMF